MSSNGTTPSPSPETRHPRTIIAYSALFTASAGLVGGAIAARRTARPPLRYGVTVASVAGWTGAAAAATRESLFLVQLRNSSSSPDATSAPLALPPPEILDAFRSGYSHRPYTIDEKLIASASAGAVGASIVAGGLMGSFTALLAYSVSFATISAIAQLTWTQTETFFRRRGELVVLQKSRAASAASASQLPDSQPDPSPASPPVRLVDVRYKVADPTSGALLDATSIGDAISAWMAERFQPPEWAYVNKVLEKEQKLEEEIVRVEERVQRLRQEMERREGLKTP